MIDEMKLGEDTQNVGVHQDEELKNNNVSEATSPDETDVNLEPDSQARSTLDEPNELTGDEGSGARAEGEAQTTGAEETSPDEGETAPSDPAALADELTQQVAQLQSQLEERANQFLRLQADFDNFRRRMQKQIEEQEEQVKCATIKQLLPAVDNFERARSQIKPQTDGEMNIHKSYQSVYKQLVDSLKRLGVAPMRSEGQPFDPNLHEAVLREPTDQHPEGTVIEELMRGYLMGERILRHAMVKVATASEPVIPSEGSSQDNAD